MKVNIPICLMMWLQSPGVPVEYKTKQGEITMLTAMGIHKSYVCISSPCNFSIRTLIKKLYDLRRSNEFDIGTFS